MTDAHRRNIYNNIFYKNCHRFSTLIIDAEFFCKIIARHRVICLKLLLYFIVYGHIMRVCKPLFFMRKCMTSLLSISVPWILIKLENMILAINS